MEVLADNDILIKGACFRVLDELFSNIVQPIGILGAAPYVVRDAIKRKDLIGDSRVAVSDFDAFFEQAEVLEPSEEEQTLAADFELAAQEEGVPLDAGESQLCAVLIVRRLRLLYTGDKRAICALEELLAYDSRLLAIRGRVRCLEQLFLECTSETNLSTVRSAVCSEAKVDTALSICFSCGSSSLSFDTLSEALHSYINDLRRQAPQVLGLPE